MKPAITEKQLIAAAQSGDAQALNELLTYHWQPVYQFIFYKVGNQHDAQDIAQETFIRAFRSLPRYQDKNAAFRTYLGRIALNLIADHWRKLGRAPQTVDVADYRGLLEDPAQRTEDQVLKHEREREVTEALSMLPQEQRQVVEMRLLAGLSVQEAAGKMSKTEAAVKMLQQRALANLRKIMNKSNEGGDVNVERAIPHRRTLKGN